MALGCTQHRAGPMLILLNDRGGSGRKRETSEPHGKNGTPREVDERKVENERGGRREGEVEVIRGEARRGEAR